MTTAAHDLSERSEATPARPIRAIGALPARTAGRVRAWLSVRHALHVEATLVLGLYGIYELTRGLVVGNADEAVRHAHELVSVERSLGLFVEQPVQDAAQAVPGLVSLLSLSYLTLHLTVTVGVLLWLHRTRPTIFPLVRTTLLLASGLALLGYLLYPTAPPRLAGLGIADTVSGDHFDLNTGLVSSVYNPFAAVPSMHAGYALVVGIALAAATCRRALKVIGALYPAFVLLVIVATGNHFLVDAVAGAAVAGLALVGARLIVTPATSPREIRGAISAWTRAERPCLRSEPPLARRDRTRVFMPQRRSRLGTLTGAVTQDC